MPKASGAHVKYMWQRQPDAVLSQINPVSNTLYGVGALAAAVEDARIISMESNITWAANQPSLLEVVETVDGNTIIYYKVNPVSVTSYGARTREGENEANQFLDTADSFSPYRAFLNDGQSVKVEARVTWPGPAQPTPLVCRVKWARLLPT